ncbi:MAG TPA: gluconate 2-dehydrogenase subunit 3 family protein [Flavisolibacter sp.]|nr:gluconate 2-dehydrogenase subunit 3 family protein [Flavisolibacter sp.]
MDRREAISKVALLLGGTIIGANAFSKGTIPAMHRQGLFTKEDEALLNEIGGTILPPIPGSPGAKSAGIGAFMVMMVTDCYEGANQKVFIDGLHRVRDDFKTAHNISFIEAEHKTRLAFLQKIDDAQTKANPAANAVSNRRGESDSKTPMHYFLMMKQLTLLGFFTSEVGATKALRYIETPGAYRGCVPYKKGDKAWATS